MTDRRSAFECFLCGRYFLSLYFYEVCKRCKERIGHA